MVGGEGHQVCSEGNDQQREERLSQERTKDLRPPKMPVNLVPGSGGNAGLMKRVKLARHLSRPSRTPLPRKPPATRTTVPEAFVLFIAICAPPAYWIHNSEKDSGTVDKSTLLVDVPINRPCDCLAEGYKRFHRPANCGRCRWNSPMFTGRLRTERTLGVPIEPFSTWSRLADQLSKWTIFSGITLLITTSMDLELR
jgi:hypothetical protein